MRPFNRLARGWRSVPAAAGLMAALLLLAGLGIIFQSESAYREQKVREARDQAEILAASVTAALDFADAAAAQESVNALRVNPQIRSAAVYDGEGALFAGFQRSGTTLPPTLAEILPPEGSEVIRLLVEEAARRCEAKAYKNLSDLIPLMPGPDGQPRD